MRSRTWVSEEPRPLGGPGVAEMLGDPAHYRFSGMEVVNYDDDPPREEPRRRRLCRWLPDFSTLMHHR